jgi:hypothetical protein
MECNMSVNSRTKSSISIAMSIMFLACGLLLYFSRTFVFDYKYFPISPIVNFAFSSVLILSGLGILLFQYLQGNIRVKAFERTLGLSIPDNEIVLQKDYRTEEFFNSVTVQLDKINSKVENIVLNRAESTIGLDTESKTNLVQAITDTIQRNISEKFIENIESKYGAAILDSGRFNIIANDLLKAIGRIDSEIRRLSFRASLNLVIGSLTTVGAALSLGYIVFSNVIQFENLLSVLSHYIPRISLIVFIEVFAFFFLKLYKSCLEDIKYYQNELVNIESKSISLKSAFLCQNDDCLGKIIELIANTERNFILKKGESTVALERIKYDHSHPIGNQGNLTK